MTSFPVVRPPLPEGFVVRLRADLIEADGGRVLVGGSPIRAVRLGARARSLLQGGRLVVDDRGSATLARRFLDGNLADPIVDDLSFLPGDLTVVVPVRDRVEQLTRCLAALAPLEVIVVDDASTDPAALARVARRFGVTLVRNDQNAGPAAARNRGLALVSTPLVAFVDSDVVVESSALLALARHCADPAVALVGPKVVGVPRSRRPRWFERYDAVASSLDLGTTSGQVRPGATIGWLPSACLVGRVELLRPGFDAAMRVGEDVDLTWRLAAGGRVVRYDPSVSARHDARTSVWGWLARKFVYGTGGADLAARHGRHVAPAVLSPVMAVGAAAVLARRWWSIPLAVTALAASSRTLRARLPVTQGATALALRLSVRGLGWAVRQETGLLLRHWWPLTMVGMTRSRTLRRAVLTALVLDLAIFLHERSGAGAPVVRQHRRVGPATAVVARRLDDLAYGAGLWWGACRARSVRALLPRSP